MNNLNCGGAEKSLVSLLQAIDYSEYNVDLYLFKREGMFLKQLPKEVTILPEPKNYPYFDMSLKRAITENLKAGRFKVIWYRILAGYVYRSEKIPAVQEQKVWKYLKNVIPALNKKYDVAIGYLEKTPNYFCVDKVVASKKIGYILNDYDQLKMDKKIDELYFSQLDSIVADSQECKNVLIKNFPQFKDKFIVQKNIVSKEVINRLSNEKVNDYPNGFKLISVGRLSYQKGYDLAINACKILVDKGLKFNWLVLGDGEEKKSLNALISDLRLNEYFVFLGIKENHYPYVKNADIFVHSARFEGSGIVITEAKILTKPIVLTNCNVANSHLNHSVNGLIADLNPGSIAKNIERLILDENLRNQFSENLAKENHGTENEITSFYELINN